MISLNPIDTLKGWGHALTTPFGMFLLLLVGIYIYLRVTGKIGGVEAVFNKGRGNNQGGNNRPPDYIIK